MGIFLASVSLYLLISVLLTIFYAIYAMLHMRNRICLLFALLALFSTVYIFGYVCELNSQNVEGMLFWNGIQYLSVPFIPGIWLLFTMQYVKKADWIKPGVVAGIFIVPVLTFIMHLTNQYHNLFYTGTELVASGPIPVLFLSKGIFYYVQSAFSLSCLVFSTALLIRQYRKSDKLERRSDLFALIASLLPYVGVLLILINYGNLGIDFAAVTFPLSCLLLMISVFKYQLLDLKPIAAKQVFENTKNGIIVLDHNYDIAEYNDSAREIFDELKKDVRHKHIRAVLGIYEAFISAVTEKTETQLEIRKGNYSKYYYISLSNIGKNESIAPGYIVTLTDITSSVVAMKILEKSEQKNRLLITQMKQGLLVYEIVTDENGKVTGFKFIDANPSFENMTGLKRKDMFDRSFFECFSQIKPEQMQKLGDVAVTGKPFQTEYYYSDLKKYFEVIVYSPQPRQFALILSDITARKEMDVILNKKRNILTAIAEASSLLLTNRGLYNAMADCIKLVGGAAGVDRVSIYKNHYDMEKLHFWAEQMLQWNASDGVVRLNAAELAGISLEEMDDITKLLAKGMPFSGKISEMNPCLARETLESENIGSYMIFPLYAEKNLFGFISFYNYSTERVLTDDGISVLQFFANAITGAIERNLFEKRIEILSYHDQLTDLYNRRFFEEEIKRLDTKRNLPVSVVMADVNGLKLTNDAFGHFLGDRLLKKAAEVIRRECRADDIIARIGGDEYAILLPKTAGAEAEKIVQRIECAIAQDNSDNIVLSVSFGIATKTEITDDMIEIIKKSEDHMYSNKLNESASIRNRMLTVIKKRLYEKNKREQRHSKRVSKLCGEIGAAMRMTPAQIEELATAGLLHDIGKIAIEEKILNKSSKLNQSEWMKMKRHPEIGYHILSSVSELTQIANYVLAHQERWDGTGYPKELAAEQIPVQARVIAIADSYDAMTSESPFREPFSMAEAVLELQKNAGKQFDPNIVRIFVDEVLHKKTEE